MRRQKRIQKRLNTRKILNRNFSLRICISSSPSWI
jgi:hypothetical protein